MMIGEKETAPMRIKDRSDWDISEWLNQGNKPKTLGFGFTHFPDGVVPLDKKQVVKPEEERNAKIERINAEVQAKKQAKKLAKKTMMEAKKKKQAEEILKIKQKREIARDAQIKEQVKVLNDFFNRAAWGDIEKLCEVSGISVKTIRNARSGINKMTTGRWNELKVTIASFQLSEKKPKQTPKPKTSEESQETLRRSKVIRLSREAIARGEKAFMAPCAKHGMTTYRIYGGAARCLECRLKLNKAWMTSKLDPNLEQVQKNRRERKEYNTHQMNEALNKNEKDFKGLCRNCGHAPFRAHFVTGRNKHEYRCMTCQNEAWRRHNMKRQEQAA